MTTNERKLIRLYRSLGLEIHTSTKARGHQGFYLKNRIDVSKDIPENRIIPTLLHEFAHHIHYKLEPTITKDGGSLSVLFRADNIQPYEEELFKITQLVDKNAKFEILNSHKKKIKQKINEFEKIIKNKYPNFLRSKKFKEFDKYIKKSEAKYLLKYDRVKLISGVFFKKCKNYSIDNIERDFTDMPKEFAAYIRLKSYQKKQARVSNKINKLKKYYTKPTELFARFVEGLYMYPLTVKSTAPLSYNRFFELLNSGYYMELSEVFELLKLHYFVE